VGMEPNPIEAEWECDQERTTYAGEEKTGKDEQRRVHTSLGPVEEWERLELEPWTKEDATRAIEAMRAAMREARQEGTTVTETVPVTLLQSTGNGRLNMDDEGPVFERNTEKYDMWKDREIARDPIARVFGRLLGFETGGTIYSRGERAVKMDESGKKVLTGSKDRDKADQESGDAMRVCAAIHAKTHFTHACATDGSRKDATADTSPTAYGIWWGADLLREGATRTDMGQLDCSEEQEEKAIRNGLEGGRLPDSWSVQDAETYAIYMAMRRVYLEAKQQGDDPKEKRLLIMSDCRAAIMAIEKAWRTQRVKIGGDRARMLEAICNVRRQLGHCVICKVKAHVGVSPNEYADATAKAYLGASENETEDPRDSMRTFLRATRWVYECRLKGGKWEMMDRAMYTACRKKGAEYARKRAGTGIPITRTNANTDGKVWTTVAEGVTKYDTTTAEEWKDVQEHNRIVNLVMGARVGDTMLVPHEREWEHLAGIGGRCEQCDGEQDDDEQEEEREGACESQRIAVASGEWGCWACRSAICTRNKKVTETLAEIDETPDEGTLESVANLPRATVKHYAGECDTASGLQRKISQTLWDIARCCKKGGANLATATRDAAWAFAEKVEITISFTGGIRHDWSPGNSKMVEQKYAEFYKIPVESVDCTTKETNNGKGLKITMSETRDQTIEEIANAVRSEDFERIMEIGPTGGQTTRPMTNKRGIMSHEEWQHVNKVLAAQLPDWKGIRKARNGMAPIVVAHIRTLAGMISAQRKASEDAAKAGQQWMRERAENHEWMRFILKAWRWERRKARMLFGTAKQETRARKEYEEGVYAPPETMQHWFRNNTLKWAAVRADGQTEEDKWNERVREERMTGTYAGSISYVERGEWMRKLDVRIRRIGIWAKIVLPMLRKEKERNEARERKQRAKRKLMRFIRTHKPKVGGAWHRELYPPPPTPRATERHELRDTEQVQYQEQRTYARRERDPGKSTMRRHNVMRIGERLRAFENCDTEHETVRTADASGMK
jgi:ribonuclease HI